MSDLEREGTLNALCFECYDNAKNHGFHDKEFNFGEKIALVHSELSEALERWRTSPTTPDEHCPEHMNLTIELADACIRIFDICGRLKLPLGGAITAKMKFNESRPYLHRKNF